MAETKIYIPDSVDAQLREAAMKRFGYGRGSISKAAEEALVQWLAREDAIKGAISAVVENARKDSNVIAVLLFGSYARKEPSFRDVDIALVAKDPDKIDMLAYGHAVEDAGALYKISVDVLVLNSLQLDTQSRILNEGVEIYVRNRKELSEFCIGVVDRWSDFKQTFEYLIA